MFRIGFPLIAIALFWITSTIFVEAEQELSLPVTIQHSDDKQARQRRKIGNTTRTILKPNGLAANSAAEMVALSRWQLGMTYVAFLAGGISIYYARKAVIANDRPMLVPNVPTFSNGFGALMNDHGPQRLYNVNVEWDIQNAGKGVAIITGYEASLHIGTVMPHESDTSDIRERASR